MLDLFIVELLLERAQSDDELVVVVKHEALTGDHLDGLGRHAAACSLLGRGKLRLNIHLQRT